MKPSTHPHRRRTWLWIILGLVALLVLALVGFASYLLYNAANPLPANTSAVEAATSNSATQFVDKGSYYAVLPTSQASSGLIIYPGAFAEPKGYVGRYAELAQRGIAVFVIRSPLNFALLDVNRAERIMRENPSITHWYVAGHSLGGVAACDFAKSHQSQINGLILLASYCNGNATGLSIPVLSISGTRDGLATPQKIAESKKNLPSNTQYVVIDGANHTQFGSFARTQGGDGSASISDAEAQQQIITAIGGFITLPGL